jgi:type II secretory pathway pseudopilin PulG
MQGFPNKLVARLCKHQTGFALMELLVVVGIIVALAAVIIPTVAKFGSKGEEGAEAAEKQNVQAAMDAMMADKGITQVKGRVVGVDPSANDWRTLPEDFDANTDADPLFNYLREEQTKFYYCWDSGGKVTRQDEAATTC